MTLTASIFFAGGIIVGAVILWFYWSSRFSIRTRELEGKVHYSEAQLNEMRQHISSKDEEVRTIRNELDTERQLKSDALARLDESRKNQEVMEQKLTNTFNALSLDALRNNSTEFLKLAEEKLKSQTIQGSKELNGKKELIDRSLREMDKALVDIKQKIEEVSRGNIRVSSLVENHEKLTSRLKDTTDHLRQALASSKKRGEWGERMAEDIIRLVGMIEGVNYSKQKTLEGSAGRPDYTFFMPNRMKINMDVKFPLDNYVHYLDARSEYDRKRFKEELIKNTKMMIKKVTTRDYINPSDNTVDYVLIFIPNEQVYSFINETDSTLIDEALKQKVVLCSPFTLYAVLAVIRQAIENFNLEKTAAEMLKLFGEFFKQWHLYKDKFRLMGERLDSAKKEYDALTTTRSNMLERPLKKIDELRKQKAISFSSDARLDEKAVLE